MNALALAAALYAGVIAAAAVVGGSGARDERTTVARPSAVDRRVLVTSTVQPTSERGWDEKGTSLAANRDNAMWPPNQPSGSELGPVSIGWRDVRIMPKSDDSRVHMGQSSSTVTLARDLTPTDRVRVLTVEQWRATLAFPMDQQYIAARTLICESGGNPRAVGAAGEQGAYQVIARFHGPVPDTLEAQAEQAARIVARESWRPWTTKEGCEQWGR